MAGPGYGGSSSSRAGGSTGCRATLGIFVVTLIALIAASSLLSSTPSAVVAPISARRHGLPPEHSFVRSLKSLLGARAPPRGSAEKVSPPDERLGDDSARDLDLAVSEREAQELAKMDFGRRPLNVYVYDMPAKFTYDLLWLFHDTYEQTVNLTSNGSPVHRLIAQHSVDYWLWADLLAPQSERVVTTVTRVYDQAEADVFYIPFFATISFFILETAQCKQLYREALKWITSQPAWLRSGGRDHVLPVHHPWSFKSVRRFMKRAIWLLPDMDSTGNWYKPGEVSLEKDVVLPYVPNVEICDKKCLTRALPQRKTLLFFRGRTKRNAGGKIRSKLIAVLQHEKGVIIEEGSTGDEGKSASQKGMRGSVFCLSPAGDTPSSARLFDAIVSGCVPVIVSDELELPFEGLLDYRKVALCVSSSQAIQPGWVTSYLRSISPHQLSDMQFHLAEVSKHFQYASPAQLLGPEDMTWRMIGGKIQSMKLHIRRAQRLVEGSRNVCSCDCRYANSTFKYNL